MEPTLSDGDNLIVDKLSAASAIRKDMILLYSPYQHAENTYYIKRIIDCPVKLCR